MNTALNVVTESRKPEGWPFRASKNASRAQKVGTHGKDPINPVRSPASLFRNRHT